MIVMDATRLPNRAASTGEPVTRSAGRARREAVARAADVDRMLDAPASAPTCSPSPSTISTPSPPCVTISSLAIDVLRAAPA